MFQSEVDIRNMLLVATMFKDSNELCIPATRVQEH